MEWNAVLPKRWNGPSKQEHLNTQHWAWSHAKQKDRDDKLAHHDEFTAELQMLSSQQADSLKLDKLLQAQIQMLQDNQNSNWKEEIKALQQQVEAEKEKRWGYKNRRHVVNKLGVSGPLLRMADMSPFWVCTFLNIWPCNFYHHI